MAENEAKSSPEQKQSFSASAPGGMFGGRGGGGPRGGGQRGDKKGGQRRFDPRQRRERGEGEFKETMMKLNRVSKTVKGGKRFSFSAFMVVGDLKGKVGVGLGKSKEIQVAIQKGTAMAKRNMIEFPLVEASIPHEVVGKFGAGKVWMKPAASGTGVKAGGAARLILEAAGVKDVLSSILGSRNSFSVAYATIEALKGLRKKEDALKLRGRD